MTARDFELTPFKELAHALVDGLPADATWQDLAAEVQFEIDLREAVRVVESSAAADPLQPPADETADA